MILQTQKHFWLGFVQLDFYAHAGSLSYWSTCPLILGLLLGSAWVLNKVFYVPGILDFLAIVVWVGWNDVCSAALQQIVAFEKLAENQTKSTSETELFMEPVADPNYL